LKKYKKDIKKSQGGTRKEEVLFMDIAFIGRTPEIAQQVSEVSCLSINWIKDQSIFIIP